MKRGIKIGLALVMIIAVTGLSIIGCAKDEAPVVAVEQIVLKHSVPHPSTNFLYPGHLMFIDRVETESEGRIKIDFYPAQTLVKSKATVEALQTGVCDMAQMTPSYRRETIPLCDWIGLPFTTTSAVQGWEWDEQLHDKYFAAAYTELGLHYMGQYHLAPYGFFTVSKPINRLEDLAGLKIKVPAAPAVAFVNAMGGEGLFISAYEVYEMLAKGTLDGVMHTPAYIHTALWHELGEPGYWTWCGTSIGSSHGSYAINKDVYDGLPADLQKILDEASHAWGRYETEQYDINHLIGLDKFAKAGAVMTTLPESEVTRMRVVADGVWEDWATEWEGMGAPGRQFIEDLRKLQKGEKL